MDPRIGVQGRQPLGGLRLRNAAGGFGGPRAPNDRAKKLIPKQGGGVTPYFGIKSIFIPNLIPNLVPRTA